MSRAADEARERRKGEINALLSELHEELDRVEAEIFSLETELETIDSDSDYDNGEY